MTFLNFFINFDFVPTARFIILQVNIEWKIVNGIKII